MVSLGSSIRSAARATFSAYRSLPVRWRLAGGSAALTFVILAAFAALVGVLTARQVRGSFNSETQSTADALAQKLLIFQLPDGKQLDCKDATPDLSDFSPAEHAPI